MQLATAKRLCTPAPEKQIEAEYNYWENVIRRVLAFIYTLAERRLALRGKLEKLRLAITRTIWDC